VELAAARLGTLTGTRVLVLGAGDMGEGMARSLVRAGVGELLVANRTRAKAEDLAAAVGGRSVAVADLSAALTDVDVLLTSTGASSVLVDHADLEPVVAARQGRSLLIIDVAVPRDVDPSAADLPGVDLLDMDDLRAFADAGLAERRREVAAVRDLIDDEVQRYREAATARQVAPLIAALRERAEVARVVELDRAAAKLPPTSGPPSTPPGRRPRRQAPARAHRPPQGGGRHGSRRAAGRGAARPVRPVLRATGVVAGGCAPSSPRP
jgi:glutamyl-tRNA reductase